MIHCNLISLYLFYMNIQIFILLFMCTHVCLYINVCGGVSTDAIFVRSLFFHRSVLSPTWITSDYNISLLRKSLRCKFPADILLTYYQSKWAMLLMMVDREYLEANISWCFTEFFTFRFKHQPTNDTLLSSSERWYQACMLSLS